MSKPRKWRVLWDAPTGRRQIDARDGEFDELVISPHVHLEMMDKRVLWIRLGDKMTTIDLRTGDVRPWEDA